MTHAHPDPLAKPSHALRRGCDREQRTIRLCWLLGWQTVAIAAHLGCHVSTVRRRMRAFDLCGPGAPGQRQRLLEAETQDRLADDLLRSGEVAKLAPLIAKHASVATTAAPSLPTEQVDTYDNDDLNGDWRDWAARLRAGRGPADAVAGGLETKSDRDGRDARPRRAEPAPAGDALHTSVPDGRPLRSTSRGGWRMRACSLASKTRCASSRGAMRMNPATGSTRSSGRSGRCSWKGGGQG